MSLRYLAGAALVLVAAFYLGRWSVPAPKPSHVKESTKESSANSWASEESGSARSESRSESSHQTSKTEEWYRPDGTLARRLVLGEVSLSRSRDRVEASASRSEAGSQVVTRDVTREVRYDPGRWQLTLGVYQDAVASLRREFRPTLGVGITYRLIGPLQAGAFASAPFGQWRQAQATVSLGLTFRF